MPMDAFNYGEYGQSQTIADARALETKESVENGRREGPRHLQKKRPPANELAYPQQTDLSPATFNSDQRGLTTQDLGPRARKGSLRYAVRRIFGRRSRDAEPPALQGVPLRHDSKDETSGVIDIVAPEPWRFQTPAEDVVQRTLSAPNPLVPQPSIRRNRSPYQFPNSASLKPLDLGNPFTRPASHTGRRKSLPSVLITKSEAAALKTAMGLPDDSPESSPRLIRDSLREGNDITTIRREKRRSRSAEELGSREHRATLSPQRKEEMRVWRESFQPDVLRASGFTTRSPVVADNVQDEDRTPLPIREDPFDRNQPQLVTPLYQRDTSIRDPGSASAFGTEVSRELEDRVARLEAGLFSFRGQLAQLSADRNRRTVLIGGMEPERDTSGADRTASMLATDLQADLEPSNYQYQYTKAVRPSTSPQPPRTPTYTEPVAPTRNFSIRDRNTADPFVSPSRGRDDTPSNSNRANPVIPPQYTFRSLYEMLSDERSARRRLEAQVKTLREDLANLHYHISMQSQMQSQHSSYYATMDPTAGSSRLHALLRETETSPPSTAQSRQHHDSGRFSTGAEELVSRFSRSESEMGGAMESEAPTPYDAYMTPTEEQGTFPFGGRPRSDEEMF